MSESFTATAAFIWSVADPVRRNFKQSQYGRITLPFMLSRGLEYVLAPSKDKVSSEIKKYKDSDCARSKGAGAGISQG
jgi:type I restriction enzyme M protein